MERRPIVQATTRLPLPALARGQEVAQSLRAVADRQAVEILAPVLLVVARLIQGFAVAGELSGASSMIVEHAPPDRRGYFASFTLQGVQAGQLLAAAVFLPLAAYLPSEAFMAWGWRVPFLLSVFVILAATNVPWAIERNRRQSVTDYQNRVHGDAAFADYALILGLTKRF